MAKLSSLDEEERLLLSLEDEIQEEASILDRAGLSSKGNNDNAETPNKPQISADRISEEFNKLLLEAIDAVSYTHLTLPTNREV